jgi:hypothetical protein
LDEAIKWAHENAFDNSAAVVQELSDYRRVMARAAGAGEVPFGVSARSAGGARPVSAGSETTEPVPAEAAKPPVRRHPRKADVKPGDVYRAKIGGKLTNVRIERESPRGGWDATNESTNRKVRIKSVLKLRAKVEPQAPESGTSGSEPTEPVPAEPQAPAPTEQRGAQAEQSPIQQTRVADQARPGEHLPKSVPQDVGDAFDAGAPPETGVAKMEAPARIQLSAPPTEGEIVGVQDVVEAMEREFQVPFRVGRFRDRAQGIYKRLAQVARTKRYGNIATAVHELGHHLENTTDVLAGLPRDIQAELRDLDYDPKQRRLKEGFAEFLRLYLTTEDAAERAPKFHARFTGTWLRGPRAESMKRIRGLIDRWRTQGALSRTIAHIDAENARFRTLRNLISEPTATLAQGLKQVDVALRNRQQVLWDAMYTLAGTRNLADIPPHHRFAVYAKVATMSAPVRARQAVLDYMPDIAGNRVGPSLREILRPIADQLTTEDGVREFEAFLYARHALDVHRAGKNPGIPLDEAQYVVRQCQNRPGWQEAARGITDWHGHLLDYLSDAGGLTEKAKALMRKKYPHYIPLSRSFEGVETRSGGTGRMANLAPGVMRLKGSSRRIISPLESSALYAERIFAVADKQRLWNMIIDAAQSRPGFGRYVEKVSPKMRPISAALRGLRKQLEAAGADLSAADMESTLTLFENLYRPSAKENVAVVWRNGQRQLYQIDPELFEAVANLDTHYSLPRGLDFVLGGPARMLRLTATGLRASFGWLTNPLRDIQTATLQTEAKGWAGMFPSVAYRSLRGIVEDLFGSETTRLFKAGGGEMAQPLSIDRRFIQEAIRQALIYRPTQNVRDWALHPIESMRTLLSIPELGPRIAEFRQSLKELGWRPGQKLTFEQYLMSQMRAANVTVDFREGGALAMFINRIVPFHNAQLQGKNRMFQALRRDPLGWTIKALANLTLPTLGLWWAYRDEEWFKDLPAHEKFLYWHVKAGDHVLRIPTPFDWFLIFGAIPLGMADALYHQDPKRFTEAVGKALDDMVPTVLPTAGKPVLEAWTNHDFFRDRPIVSPGLEYLNPEEQYYGYTTETAKAIGRWLGIAPAKIEHVVDAHTARLATNAIGWGEDLLRKAGLIESKGRHPSDASSIPVLGRLFLRPTVTRVFDDFYIARDTLRRQQRTWKRRGEPEPAEHRARRRGFDRAARWLADLSDRTRSLLAQDIPDDQKREKWLEIHKQRVRIAKDALAGTYPGAARRPLRIPGVSLPQ